MIGAFFVAGCIALFIGVRGIRRGEFKYYSDWFHRRHDGIVFWIFSVISVLAGALLVLFALNHAFQFFIEQ